MPWTDGIEPPCRCKHINALLVVRRVCVWAQLHLLVVLACERACEQASVSALFVYLHVCGVQLIL